MLSRDSVHLSKLKRNPNKCVKIIISKRNNLSVTRNREVKQFYVVPINDDEFSLSWSPSTLNVGCMYFVTYIPTDVTGQRLQGSADLKKGDEVGEQRKASGGVGGGRGALEVPNTTRP